ncbi:MAG: hypothetical protein ACI9RZ_001255, partial [Sphingobacteriales bacterium]
ELTDMTKLTEKNEGVTLVLKKTILLELTIIPKELMK